MDITNEKKEGGMQSMEKVEEMINSHAFSFFFSFSFLSW
jgi:hypothetical protein